MHILGKLVQVWKAPSMTHRDATFSLHPPILATLGSSQHSFEGNLAGSFPSLPDPGGAPASKDSSQAISPWHFFDALEEPMLEEELSKQALQITQLQHEVESLKMDVRHLVLLHDSFDKSDRDILELRKGKGRQARSFSSLYGRGGAPAFIGSCFQAASSSLENAEPVKHEPSQQSPHTAQLLAAVDSSHKAVVHLEALIQSDSFNKSAYNTLGLELLRTEVVDNKHDQECVRDRACKSKLGKGKGEHNRVDIPEQQQNKLRTLGQNKQLLEGQLRHDLDSQQKTNSFEQLRLGEHKNKPKSLQEDEAEPKAAEASTARSEAYSAKPQEEQQRLTEWCNNAGRACRLQTQQPLQHHKTRACKRARKKQQQTAAASQHELHLGSNNSLGIGEQQPMGSLEQQTLAFESPKQNLGHAWRILVDTGAELSVAPWSFAEDNLLSPLEEAIELHTATGEAITTFGIRIVQLQCQGFSFIMDFVIADVEQPLLGLGSLLRENLSLQLDSYTGYQLSNRAGEQIQLEHSGQQVYLVAYPVKLELESCLVGNLLDSSLMPDTTKLEHKMSLIMKSKRCTIKGEQPPSP